MVVEDWRLSCRFLVHDRDTSFAALDGVLKTNALHILKTPPHTPLCNAYAERHVREIRETLENLILLGESHLRRVLSTIEEHHNTRGPHQGLGNVIPLDFELSRRTGTAYPGAVRGGTGWPFEPLLAQAGRLTLWN